MIPYSHLSIQVHSEQDTADRYASLQYFHLGEQRTFARQIAKSQECEPGRVENTTTGPIEVAVGTSALSRGLFVRPADGKRRAVITQIVA